MYTRTSVRRCHRFADELTIPRLGRVTVHGQESAGLTEPGLTGLKVRFERVDDPIRGRLRPEVRRGRLVDWPYRRVVERCGAVGSSLTVRGQPAHPEGASSHYKQLSLEARKCIVRVPAPRTPDDYRHAGSDSPGNTLQRAVVPQPGTWRLGSGLGGS